MRGLIHFSRAPRISWTSGRIQTKTYGFTRQKTRCWSVNLILISCMSFLVDFRPKRASERAIRITGGFLVPRAWGLVGGCAARQKAGAPGTRAAAQEGRMWDPLARRALSDRMRLGRCYRAVVTHCAPIIGQCAPEGTAIIAECAPAPGAVIAPACVAYRAVTGISPESPLWLLMTTPPTPKAG
jgi:hypothetical protein